MIIADWDAHLHHHHFHHHCFVRYHLCYYFKKFSLDFVVKKKPCKLQSFRCKILYLKLCNTIPCRKFPHHHHNIAHCIVHFLSLFNEANFRTKYLQNKLILNFVILFLLRNVGKLVIARDFNDLLWRNNFLGKQYFARGMVVEILCCGFAEQKLQQRLGTDSPT